MPKISRSWDRSASTALSMPGYCSLHASARPSWAVARWTWPSEAAAAASSSKSWNLERQSGPSSAAMRRRTNGRPIGGAAACSWASSAAYSLGSASGMVASSWATFMSGPLRPPSARRSSSACWGLSISMPRNRALARRGARDRRPCSGGQLRVQLIDHPGQDRQPLGPEFGVRGIEPERRQQLLVPERAAGGEQLEIAAFETLRLCLIDRVQRVHQAVPESVGVDVERHVHEVRDVAPVDLVGVLEMERRAEALGLDLEPQRTELVGGQLGFA